MLPDPLLMSVLLPEIACKVAHVSVAYMYMCMWDDDKPFSKFVVNVHSPVVLDAIDKGNH